MEPEYGREPAPPGRTALGAPGTRVSAGPPIRVLCVTPSGLSGRGGIDRLYYYLRTSGADLPGIALRFGAARGGADKLWPLAFPAHLARLAGAMLTFRPEVVHINFAMRGSALRKYAVLRLAGLFGARTVMHLHDSLPTASLARGGFAGRLFLAICRRADAVVALGEPTAAAMRACGVDPARIRIVLNGIPDFAPDLALPKAPHGPVHILLAGRVGPHKGTDVLLDALALLRARGVAGWVCTVAGDGAVEAARARAAALGLADVVAFTGWLDADAVQALMRAAQIVVLPSIAEALPLSLVEGACAGAALVATPVGNVCEILREGENGRLVPREPAALADALAGLIADPETRGRMQVASRRHYEARLTVAALAASLAALYRDLAAAARPAAEARMRRLEHVDPPVGRR